MYDPTIPRRIKQRREGLNLAGYQLAKMAGISPSYLSLIENGQKLPSEDVAERLAKALGDDPELYRAWVEAADDPDLLARVERLEKMRQVRIDPGMPLATSGRAGGILHRRGRSRAREERVFPSAAYDLFAEEERAFRLPRPAPGTREVPILPEGTDPSRVDADDILEAESIAVDASLAPDTAGLLFAYRATERGVERIKNLVRPGDVLVFAADPQGVDPLAIYAVRSGGRIVLSRIVYTESRLLLLGGDPYQDPITLDVGDEAGLLRALAGVVVTGIRSWPLPAPLEPRGAQAALGRSGKLEDGNIVRDCEWKENYGWRPVQKAEDVDYLDAHPGTTVQFRLLRDGRVKYVLEMDAGQWREALGSYHATPGWRRNGYIVAITKRKKGEYTEEFQDRWAAYVRRPEAHER